MEKDSNYKKMRKWQLLIIIDQLLEAWKTEKREKELLIDIHELLDKTKKKRKR